MQVPDHLRINADKKRRQMVLLEESVYSIKMSFNDRFLALRNLKVCRLVSAATRSHTHTWANEHPSIQTRNCAQNRMRKGV
jgi:hypothetical protein